MHIEVTTTDETRNFGEALGRLLQAGDLLMLKGELGAGKTTFAQGIGRGMQVRGTVSSPTYIVARRHTALGSGPDFIHVDAYRVTGLDDMETLDLDSTIDECVTVVEWGEGKVENLSDFRLEIDITRGHGGHAETDGEVIALDAMDDGRRRITFHPYGLRWESVIEAAAQAAGVTIHFEEDSSDHPVS